MFGAHECLKSISESAIKVLLLIALILPPCQVSGQATSPASRPATSPAIVEKEQTSEQQPGQREGRPRRRGGGGERPGADDRPSTQTQGQRPDSDPNRSLKDDDGMVTVNLREAKIDQIVKFISDNTGKAVILQPGLEGTINIIAPKPLPVAEALDLIYESLLLHKIVVIEAEKRLAIVSAEKSAAIPLPVESGAPSKGSTLMLKVVPLKYISPESAISLTSPLLENKDAIKAIPQANAITIRGTGNEVSRVESILKEVDQIDATRMEIRIFPLKSAQATTISNQLQSLLAVVFSESAPRKGGGEGGGEQQGAQEGGGKGRQDQTKTRVIPDESNRRLIVAATPAILSYVAELIEQLDQTNPDAFAVNHIQIRNADPQSIANLVGQIYRELGGTDADRKSVRVFAQGRSLFVVSPKERFREVASLVEKIDLAEPVMELRVYRLEHAEANQVTQIVQDILRSGALLQPAASQPASSPASAPAGAAAYAGERMRRFEDRVRSSREQTEGGERSGGPRDGDMRGFIMERLMGGGNRQERGSQPQPTVAADERLNALVVVAYPEQQDQLKSIIKEIDSAEPSDMAIRLVNVPSGKAEDIQRAVQSLFQSRGRSRDSREGVQISSSPDGKKLIVLSRAKDFEQVKEIVDQLQGGENIKLHTVAVNFGDPALLAEMVMEVNASLGKTTSTVSVSPHLNGKSLLVMASEEDFTVIKGLIEELDNKQSITLKVFELKNADAEALSGMVESAIEAGYATEAGASVRRPADKQQSRRQRREGEQAGSDSGVQVYPDKRTNTLVVVGTPEDIEVVGDLIARMDRDVPLDLSVRSIDLMYTRASEIQNALQRVFQRLPHESDRDIVEITATKDDKRLIVLSSEENYKKVMNLLKELDSKEEAELTVIQLKYADASSLASVLGNMLRTAKASGTGRRNGQEEVYTVYGESGGLFTTKSDVTIIAETRINALLVAAAPEDLKVIQDLVEKLDRPREEQLNMHIMQLNYADATSVANAAGQFFETKSSSPRDEIKIMANVYDNSIMIFASDENWARIQKFVKDMDVADVGKRGTKTYELKYIDAARLAAQLEELYSEQPTTSFFDYFYGSRTQRQDQPKINFVASPIGNRLMVVAPPQEISKIDELVAQLDSPEALEGVRPRIYYIRHTDATQMKDILTDLFEGTETTTGARNLNVNMYRPQNQRTGNANTSLGEVSFVVDRDANALIAFSSNPANLDMVDDLINQLDILAPESTNTETVQLEYADAYNMAILLNSLYGGALPRQSGSQDRGTQQQQQYNQNEEQSSVTLAPSRTLEQKPEYGDLYFWWQSSNERQNEEARPISTLIEQVRIVPDLRTNSLLLTAAPHHLQPLKALIAYLDRPEPQVVIKTRIVEIIKRGEERTGVRWTPDPSTIRPEELDNAVTVLGSLNLIESFGDEIDSTVDQGPSIRNSTITRDWADAGQHIIDADTNLTLLIQLLLKNSDSRELSKPTLTVDNNETGTIFVGSDVPFITDSQINTNGARNDSYEYREVGTRLDITPHINSKGQVVLEIDLGSSNIREGEQLFGGAILDRRTYSTQIALEDSQTLVLGGILGKIQRDVLRKAPILGDIPVICHAFRKTERLDEDTELVAFVTPQVLWNRSDADHATSQIIRETNPENADFYPLIAPPTPVQQQDMIQLDQRREELTAARTADRTRAWEYNLQKLREGPDQLNRAYEILTFDDNGAPQPPSLPPVVVPQTAPAEKTDAAEAPSLDQADAPKADSPEPVAVSSETDVMRARLNELLDAAQKEQASEPQAAAPGAVLEMIEVK